MDAFGQGASWANLPDHIIVLILSYLPLKARHRASLVCKSWNQCFYCGTVWSQFTCHFYMPNQKVYVEAVNRFGGYMKKVYIELDQSVATNREYSCKVLTSLADQDERRLQKLKVRFMGENPYFYAGQEFVAALMVLFGPVKDSCQMVQHVQEIDFSGLTVAYDEKLFNTLSENHRHIKILNIQNRVLVCRVTPTCLLRLVQRCRKLEDLSIYNYSLSEDVLLAFREKDRSPLTHLSIVCRREEKYGRDINDAAWKALSNQLPNLRVSLGFDHTCPYHKVADVMKPDIPVCLLRLETFTYIYDEVRQAARNYSKTLVKMILQTPTSRNSPELNSALIELATECTKLEALYVFCTLEQSTVDRILELHPKMKRDSTYRLSAT